MQVITNNQPRDTLTWFDLTPRERAEFDHYRNEDDGAVYVRYNGAVYDLGEFVVPSRMFVLDHGKWNGVHTDTCFSAILCRFINHGERVIMGRAYA